MSPDNPAPSDRELLAALLGGRGASSLVAATCLLGKIGSLAELRQWSVVQLRRAGLSPGAAGRVKAGLELGARALRPRQWPAAVRSPQDAFALMAPYVIGVTHERFVVAVLDVKNRPCHVAAVAEGSIEHCPLQPRDVLRVGLAHGGVALIVAHNHPSGDPAPSADDVRLTERLRAAGDLVGLALLDHVVIGDARCEAGEGGYFSFARAGLLKAARTQGEARGAEERSGANGAPTRRGAAEASSRYHTSSAAPDGAPRATSTSLPSCNSAASCQTSGPGEKSSCAKQPARDRITDFCGISAGSAGQARKCPLRPL